jgi:hypothetical protein
MKRRSKKVGGRKKRKKKSQRTNYKDKLWKIFSRYVRLRDNGICFTCGVRKHYRQLQAGHFIHNVLDFDEKNIHAQCVYCNKFKRGMGQEYAIRIVQKYGPECLLDLKARATRALAGERMSDEEYADKYEYYKAKVKELEEDYVF